ncbi:MAG: YhdH/YhfP family quinone oxidoreductase [Pseudomonadales bacterium]|nr:YhdH/YhfP family quinone oxidoreductase [Pseudomonadales bacterium]
MTTYKSLWIEETEDGFSNSIVERNVADLPAGELIIQVHYSSLNFKDALSASGNKGVTRQFPHQPGIDAAGVVLSSSQSDFSEGDEVIVTGYDLGMNTAGGLGQVIAVPAAWAIKKPEGLSLRESMLLGTAGLTAGLCINKLLKMGLKSEHGDVLVTGATGGVGSIAVFLLAQYGFTVAASTGKSTQTDFLKSIGASDVIARDEFSDANKKPLLKERFAAAIDVAGGQTLSNVLKQIKAGGSVAICGLVESPRYDATVLPFILRGINLLGVDSVEIPVAKKQSVWQTFAQLNDYSALESINTEISLNDVPGKLDAILKGEGTGHYLVNMSDDAGA